MIRLLFVLTACLAFAACDSGTTPDGSDVTATGTLQNSFGRPVDGATLTFTSAGTAGSGAMQPTFTTASTATGSFSIPIPTGAYSLTITHPAYGTTTSTLTVGGTGTVALTTPPITGPGALTTQLINALNGQPVGGASIQCAYRRPDGSYPGPPVFDFSVTTSPTGAVTVSGAPFGPMRCTVVAAFGTTTFDVTIASTGTTSPTTVAATPLPGQGQFRVVLTWGTAPSDLDSHLTGPLAGGNRFHVYFSAPTSGDNNLDLDDVSGEGPETTTINASVSGIYRYSVHNYSTQGVGGAQGIAASPTRVQLFGATGLLKTYTAPTASASAGNAWRVFEITVAGSSFTISDGNGAGLGYVTATDAGDAGTFLTGGGGEAPMPKGLSL